MDLRFFLYSVMCIIYPFYWLMRKSKKLLLSYYILRYNIQFIWKTNDGGLILDSLIQLLKLIGYALIKPSMVLQTTKPISSSTLTSQTMLSMIYSPVFPCFHLWIVLYLVKEIVVDSFKFFSMFFTFSKSSGCIKSSASYRVPFYSDVLLPITVSHFPSKSVIIPSDILPDM